MKYFPESWGGGVKPAPASKSGSSGHSAICRFSKHIAFQAFFALCIAPSPALAQDSRPTTAITDQDTVAQIGDADTHLAVDTEKNIIRIMIEGKEVGRFDKNGLHVVGDIDYTGSLSDTSPAWLERTLPETGGKNAK
ncbi:hypothetical protein [Nitrosospira multiformis]|uniref:Uncharacterized protein n=1 Tax=Nitrosospira multiformis TaxID=1231 RepID=A0A1I7FSY5_9PROT|nr:hypothetical protein [Nitrosospira multiformis]SFU39268.1 hypothetical protein SAMN05216417_102185 [Nitrosospira multiformis]